MNTRLFEKIQKKATGGQVRLTSTTKMADGVYAVVWTDGTKEVWIDPGIYQIKKGIDYDTEDRVHIIRVSETVAARDVVTGWIARHDGGSVHLAIERTRYPSGQSAQAS